MTLTERIKAWLAAPEPERAAKAVTDLAPWRNATPLTMLSGMSAQERAGKYLRAYSVGWFNKAGRKISADFANLPLIVSDGDSEAGMREARIDEPDLDIDFDRLDPIGQFLRLMETPNPYQTGRALRQKTQIRVDFGGAAIWYLENGNGTGLPTAIYGISPARMWPSYNRQGRLIGWVLDADQPRGGVPFDASEILVFSAATSADEDWIGTSVVEAVYSEVPLTDMIARHTADVLSTGGRLAGMLWPKERSLDEPEFLEAQRAWRNVSSDPNAARRLLLFPEPMEWSQAASTPAEIGIPELAELNQHQILTAFPIGPEMLGQPMPSGMNASGETRRELEKWYWKHTIDPRADLFVETVKVGLLSRYERVMGQTFNLTLDIPSLDDPSTLLEKAGAFRSLVSIGFDPKEVVRAVELDHIKWLGLPELLDPAKQAEMQEQAAEAQSDDGARVVVRDDTPRDNTATQQTLVGKAAETPAERARWLVPEKAAKARDDIAGKATGLLSDFLTDQRERVVSAIRTSLPSAKADRKAWAAKADPEWWNAAAEDAELTAVLRVVYQDSALGSLQVVANTLDRVIPNRAVARITDDLLTYGGERIRDINARTLQAISIELAEGTRRGYTIGQLIDGVPDEGFRGVLNVGLDNGVGVWGDARAETIARTETALSYNRAALRGYGEFNVRQVQAIDGDTDAECAARNGATFALDDALSIADHPNGTLDWVPVI